MRVLSMKSQLIIGLLLLLIPLRILTGYLSLQRNENSIILAIDLDIEDSLRGIAKLVRLDANHKLVFSPNAQAIELLETKRLDSIFYQILSSEGEYIGGNTNLPFNLDFGDHISFNDQVLNEQEVRVGTLRQELFFDGDSKVFYVQLAQTLNGRYHAIYFTYFDFIEALILTSLLIALSVWWCVRKTLKPLESISQDLEQRGQLDFRPLDEQSVASELRPLVAAFNLLLNRLEGDMSVQRRFLENAAHELKTPLAVLKTQIELTLRESNHTKRSNLLSQIMVSVNRTSNLSKKLLSVSNASSLLAHQNDFEICDLVQIAKEVIVSYLSEASAKNIDLGFDCEEDQIFVMGDPSALYELIANLVENAIRYANKNGNVDVHIENFQTPILYVSDDGDGIPTELRERVFERFFRVLGTKVEGSGLGLAIVKEIAESHGAQVSVKSGVGEKGTVMMVSFKPIKFTREYYDIRKSKHFDS